MGKKIKCNRDCFNCIYDDCVVDFPTYSEKSLYKNRSFAAQEYQKLYAKKKRDEARAKGLCLICRKKKATHGSKCYECYLRQKRHDKAKYDGRREYWREEGLCYFCGDPCMEGQKTCEKHYQILKENIGKTNANPTEKMKKQRKRFNVWRENAKHDKGL